MDSLEIRLELALLHSRPRLSQDALAKALGVNKSWISGVKKGRWNGDAKLRQAAEIMGVPAEWLVSGTGPAPGWVYFNEDDEIPDAKEPHEQAPAWAVELLREVKSLHAEVVSLKSRLPAPSDAGTAAVRDIRAALEPNEREHEQAPTYPARSPDLTGAPRHGK